MLPLPLPCLDRRLSHAPSGGEAEAVVVRPAMGGSTPLHSPLRRQLRTTWLISCSSYVSSLLAARRCWTRVYSVYVVKTTLVQRKMRLQRVVLYLS